MCGIGGIWHRDGEPVDPLGLERMAAMLTHRGPDGYGMHLEHELGMVNRRLRILDLSEAADQPMSTAGGALSITFNGEIHNYVELRRELEAHGASFRTVTDTEVVLQAYAAWGEDCFERFNGMWALALWDARERRLVLCRDRFGIKPLYYSVRGARLAFASEPKAILAVFPEERVTNTHEVERFLAGDYPDSGEATFYANMLSVGPATSMVFSASGQPRTNRYWGFAPGIEEPRPEAESEFRELLADAVRLRTRSDVPVGVCVSGGLDSSAIASLLDVPAGGTVHAFSTRYDLPSYDESRYAKLVADAFGLTVHWVRPEPRGMLDTIRRITWHHDAPTPFRGRYASWFVMREASRHVKVVLQGQGGDELLAGYSRDAVPYLIDRARLSGTRGADLLRETLAVGRIGNSLHWFFLTGIPGHLRDPRARHPRPYASTLNNVLWNGLRRYGLKEILHGDDAISMAFSLECRAPFLDHRLVELCFSLPFHEKVADGWTKSLLRRSFEGILPAEILQRRRKYGFVAPVLPWLRQPEARRAVTELLLDPRSLERGLVDRRRLELELRAFHSSPTRYARMRLGAVWRWITLELWFRDFIDGEGLSPAPAIDSRPAEAFPTSPAPAH